MTFALDFQVMIDDSAVDSATLTKDLEKYREQLADPGDIDGAIVVSLDGKAQEGEFEEPLLRLVNQWVQKLAWVVGGDTETVAFRNSEHCYAFVPTGDSVEFSLFEGSESEIEGYVIEPNNVRLDSFATASIALAERVLEMVKQIDASQLQTHEDCKDLQTSLDEGRKAWRDHQLHQRRKA